MSDQPKVSVIMPSLNVGPYIKQCIDSVIRQTLRDIEIICVDAGSTDGTLQVLEEYAEKDRRIRLIRSEQKSYGYQMNLGLNAAKGEYIGIVETDDFIEPDMFERLYQSGQAFGAEVVKANYYRYQSVSEEKNTFSELFAGLPYNQLISSERYPSIIRTTHSIWSGIYQRDFLRSNDICFLETPGASYQDTSFILKVWVSAQRIVLRREAFLHYRTDNENSSVNSGAKVFFVCDEFQEVHRFLDERPEKRARFDAILWAHKAGVYTWNYHRLADEYKPEFLYRAASEFAIGDREGRVDRSLLSPESRSLLEPFLAASQGKYTDVMAEAARQELAEVRASASYRIGRRITWLPRMIRGGVRCYREHGWIYTKNRVLIRLHIKSDSTE